MPALTHLVSSNILALRATTTDAAASATTSTFVGYDSDDYGDDDGYFWYSEVRSPDLEADCYQTIARWEIF